MKINPFSAVEDYPQMLNKISAFVTLISLGCVLLLRFRITEIDNFFNGLLVQVNIFDNPISLGTVLLAVLIALISRIIKLHDRISDVMKIRYFFDIYHILIPMSLLSEANLTSNEIERIKHDRKNIMRDVFYKYATSGGKEVIDKHYITMALDQWTWFWILLEGSVLLVITAAISYFYKDAFSTSWLLFIVLVSTIVMYFSYNQSVVYAEDEIKLILENDERKMAIKGVFDALSSK
ncbi:MAG: hypothetical protein AB1894_15870 [Chloroflexota bacterium]